MSEMLKENGLGADGWSYNRAWKCWALPLRKFTLCFMYHEFVMGHQTTPYVLRDIMTGEGDIISSEEASRIVNLGKPPVTPIEGKSLPYNAEENRPELEALDKRYQITYNDPYNDKEAVKLPKQWLEDLLEWQKPKYCDMGRKMIEQVLKGFENGKE